MALTKPLNTTIFFSLASCVWSLVILLILVPVFLIKWVLPMSAATLSFSSSWVNFFHQIIPYQLLIIILNLGGIFRDSFLEEWEGGNITPCLKLARILCYNLEIWYVSTHSYLNSENIPLPFSAKVLLILLISAILGKK